MVKSKEYYWFESTYSVIAKKAKKGKKVVLIKMVKKFYVLSRKWKNLNFIVFYSKKWFFPFPDAWRGNFQKQITFFFLNPLWRRKNISSNLTLSHF